MIGPDCLGTGIGAAWGAMAKGTYASGATGASTPASCALASGGPPSTAGGGELSQAMARRALRQTRRRSIAPSVSCFAPRGHARCAYCAQLLLYAQKQAPQLRGEQLKFSQCPLRQTWLTEPLPHAESPVTQRHVSAGTPAHESPPWPVP